MKNVKHKSIFRALFYLNIEIILIIAFLFVLKNNTYLGNLSLYVNTQIIASIFAFISGILAIIKYYTRKKSKYIFIGIGLLGAAFIDIFHLSYNYTIFYLHSWKWNPSLAFYSTFIFISYLAWYYEVILKRRHRINQKLLLICSSLLLIIGLALSIFIDFSRSFLTVYSLIFLTPSIILVIKKGVWKFKFFEHWFLASLIVAFWSNILFAQIIVQPHDLAFVVFEITKVFIYGLNLIGLLMSTFNAFLLVEKYGETVEARLKASIESFPLGYVLVNSVGDLEVANQKTYELLAVSNISSLKQILSRELNIDLLCKKCDRLRSSVKLDDVFYNSKFLNIILTPVYYDHNNVGTVILIHDITEEKLLDKTKDEFIALASHELRTPLSTIKGNTELINDYYKKDIKNKEVHQMVDDIHISCLRLIDIVEEFLDVTNIEQKKITFKKESFPLYVLVEEIINSFAKTNKNKALKFDSELLAKHDPVVKADRSRTKQILFNLIGNSIKFTKKGQITISVNKLNDHFAEFLISDTGRGISKQSQSLLFKKFQQVDEDILLHDSSKGVGLGLYICKTLVDNMGGDIYLVSSKVDKGTTFGVKLPLDN